MPQQKRKHVVVTIQQKLEILQELDNGAKAKHIAAKYNLGSSTVHDIKKNREKLLEYSSSMATSLIGLDKRHTMKESPFALLNKAVLQWFNHERNLGNTISGVMIVQRAKELFVTLGLEGTFDGSNAWLCRFKDRYGIRAVGDSLDCVLNSMDVSSQQVLDSKTIKTREEVESEFVQDVEEAGDTSFAPENDPNNEISIETKTEVTEDYSIEDSTFSPSNKITNDTDININIPEQEDESMEDNCVCHNLKSIVQKLHSVSDKLVSESLCDSYDEFSKYISSLLRGLPKKKALNLKKKLVNDIIDVWLAHESGDQESSLSEATPKKATSKQSFRKNIEDIKELNCRNSSCSQEDCDIESVPSFISNQTTSTPFKEPYYHSATVAPSTECESIRTVTSTADGTLLAITLPPRGSVVGVDVSRKPLPLVKARPRIKGVKRKLKSGEHVSERNTRCKVTVTSRGVTNESSECSYMIEEDGTEAEYEHEDGGEISDVNLSEGLEDDHLNMILVKEEPDLFEEDIPPLFLCDMCLTHCSSKEELFQHVQQDHPGCDPTFKEEKL